MSHLAIFEWSDSPVCKANLLEVHAVFHPIQTSVSHLVSLVGLDVRQGMHLTGHSIDLPHIVDKRVSVAIDGDNIYMDGVVTSGVHTKERQGESWEHSPARN